MATHDMLSHGLGFWGGLKKTASAFSSLQYRQGCWLLKCCIIRSFLAIDTISLLLKGPEFSFNTISTALLNAPHGFLPFSLISTSADVSFAWQPLSKIPSSCFRNGLLIGSSSWRGKRNMRLASGPNTSAKCVPMSPLILLVRDVKYCRIDSKGICFGLQEGGVTAFLGLLDGPICSFSLSMRPPLWQESERMVKVAPFGTRFTSCLKSTPAKRFNRHHLLVQY